MKTHLLIAVIFLCMSYSFGQVTERNIDSENRTIYHLGIGNEDPVYYDNLLDLIQEDQNIAIVSFCEKEQKLSISVRNQAFKSYDVVKNMITSLQPGIKILRKKSQDQSIDCNNEYQKH